MSGSRHVGATALRAVLRAPVASITQPALRTVVALPRSDARAVESRTAPGVGFAASALRSYSNIATTADAHHSPPTKQALVTPTASIVYYNGSHDRHKVGDPSKKAFTYFVLTGGRFIYASAIRVTVLKFLMTMTATKDVLALASVEIDLSNIAMGSTVTIKWRGKPVFIRRRTAAEIADAASVDVAVLRDPQADAERAVQPEWLITVGVCTHLGCVPLANAGDYGGWFCPCHGSHYDVSGRIRKGPAPYNLEVPEYTFLDDGKVRIG